MLKKLLILACLYGPIAFSSTEQNKSTRTLDVVSHESNIQNIITGYVDCWRHLKQAPFKNFLDAKINNMHFLPGLPVLLLYNVDNTATIQTHNIEHNPEAMAKSSCTITKSASEQFRDFRISVACIGSHSTGNGKHHKNAIMLNCTHYSGLILSLAHSHQYNLLAIGGARYAGGIELYDSRPDCELYEASLNAHIPTKKLQSLIYSYMGKNIGSFGTGGDSVYALAVSPNGQFLAAGLINGPLELYDLSNQTCVWSSKKNPGTEADSSTIKQHDATIYAVAIHNNTIYSASHDGTVQSWDLLTGKHIGQIGETQVSPIISLAVSSDGRYLAAGSAEGTIEIYANLAAQLKKYCSK